MRRWVALIVAGWLMASWSPARAAEATLQDFYGAWRCVDFEVVENGAPLELTADDLDVTIRPDGDGFRVRWTALTGHADGEPDRQTIDALFAPTDRPGVYAYEREPGSLLGRLFASPSTGNPLEGETLLWARLEGPALIVYSLKLTERGGFDLDRYERRLGDDGMTLAYVRRTEAGEALVIDARLQAGR